VGSLEPLRYDVLNIDMFTGINMWNIESMERKGEAGSGVAGLG